MRGCGFQFIPATWVKAGLCSVRGQHDGDRLLPTFSMPVIFSKSRVLLEKDAWAMARRTFYRQRMQTIGLFVFEQGLASAGAGWWTSVPKGVGPLEQTCHIKPPLPEDQRHRLTCGATLVQTTSSKLRLNMTKHSWCHL